MVSGSNLQKRRLLFLFGCIIARLYVSHWLCVYTNGENVHLMPIIGVILCSIGIGFWYIYWFDVRKTGVEVFGDEIWWNNLRPFHGMMYLLAGGAIFSNDTSYKHYGWKLIFIDTIVGLVKHLEHHYG